MNIFSKEIEKAYTDLIKEAEEIIEKYKEDKNDSNI